MTKKILIVAVNYLNYPTTIKFIEEFKGLYLNIELADLIIVDNASDNEEYEGLNKYTCDNIQIIRTSENLGYFGGAKLAFKKDIYDNSGYDFYIISNNDIEFPDKNFLIKLSERNLVDKVGCLAPKVVVKGSQLNQNPFMVNEPSKKYIRFNRFFLASYRRMVIRDFLSKIKQKSRGKSNGVFKSGTSIFAPHGSLVILTKTYFEKGGYIDDGYFLYGEELSVGYQCLKLDLEVIYDDSLKLIHNEHQTTIGKYSEFKYKCQKKAFEYILEKYITKGVT
jgi:GT2 family glycosyltransferase